MKKIAHSLAGTILGAGLAALISGCGGGSDNISTAYLVDSNVSGVAYRCGSQSGFTGDNGEFRFQHGQACTFSIGATQFSVTADRLQAGKPVTPFDIFAGDDEKAINLARLMQTLDDDGNASNGIRITEQVRNQFQSQIRFDANFEGDMTMAMNQIRAQIQTMTSRQVRTRVQALAHLAENVPTPTAYHAFERIAEIDLSEVSGADAANSEDPTVVAKYVARKIAKYFYMTNDKNDISSADWILAGAPYTNGSPTLTPDTNVSALDPYILEIPHPTLGKTMIVEVCNKSHAGMAMGMSGPGNSPALPCEISIYLDTTTKKVYVDILDPVGSFAIFFNEYAKTTTAEVRAMLGAMALQVKTEIKLISYNGLDNAAIAYEKKAEAMGPSFTPEQISALTGHYLTLTYDIDTSSSAWIAADNNVTKQYQLAKNAASALITAMTVNNVNSGSYGINGTDLNATLVNNPDYNLSADAYWRSARSAPLSVPRSSNSADDFMYTVEACSPTHAKVALSLGSNGDSRNHAGALPCQMTFYIDVSTPSAPKLKVEFLSPAFMFNTLFSDMMSQTHSRGYTSQQLQAMVTTVTNDLVNMTRYVMDHNSLGWIVANPSARAQ